MAFLVWLLGVEVDWVSRRAAYVEWTVRECQDATQVGLVQIRRRFIDTANTLLDAADLPSIRTASRIVYEHFPPVAKVADVSDPRIEDLSDIPDAELDRMRETLLGYPQRPWSPRRPSGFVTGWLRQRRWCYAAAGVLQGVYPRPHVVRSHNGRTCQGPPTVCSSPAYLD